MLSYRQEFMYVVPDVLTSEVFFFSFFFQFFGDTLTLLIIFLITKINIFRGDLTDISAETTTVVLTQHHIHVDSSRKYLLFLRGLKRQRAKLTDVFYSQHIRWVTKKYKIKVSEFFIYFEIHPV